jgi:signal transduction histidine kinase
MTPSATPAELRSRPHRPRPTVRLRLTALYGTLFLLSGAGLLAITYLIAEAGRFLTISTGPAGAHLASWRPRQPPPLGAVTVNHPRAAGHQQTVINLHQLLLVLVIALAITTVISIALGWLTAGRILRPLRTITGSAREISATNLHQRLALDGPNDELKELGETFDELLARLESSFAAQRQFVANASHELRTPLARQRTLIEIALGDPHPTIDSLQANHRRLLAAGEQQERLIEALLTLARSERGIDHREQIDLSQITGEVIRQLPPDQSDDPPTVNARLGPAPLAGDPRLLRRLVSNLLENALRYNKPGGHVDITVCAAAKRTRLTISNTGPTIPADEVTRLRQPFQRLTADRPSKSNGHGLGLSIVAAIANAHDAELEIQPCARGGLRVMITFPEPAPHPDSRPRPSPKRRDMPTTSTPR